MIEEIIKRLLEADAELAKFTDDERNKSNMRWLEANATLHIARESFDDYVRMVANSERSED